MARDAILSRWRPGVRFPSGALGGCSDRRFPVPTSVVSTRIGRCHRQFPQREVVQGVRSFSPLGKTGSHSPSHRRLPGRTWRPSSRSVTSLGICRFKSCRWPSPSRTSRTKRVRECSRHRSRSDSVPVAESQWSSNRSDPSMAPDGFESRRSLRGFHGHIRSRGSARTEHLPSKQGVARSNRAGNVQPSEARLGSGEFLSRRSLLADTVGSSGRSRQMRLRVRV